MWKFDLFGIWEFLRDTVVYFFTYASGILPLSPVDRYLTYIEEFPYLGYLNWFCHVGTCSSIFGMWVVVVGAYYLYSVILRWIKVVQ